MANAVCSPQAAPSPAPSSANDTVMQCIVEIVQIDGPNGWSMLSSRWLDEGPLRAEPARDAAEPVGERLGVLAPSGRENAQTS